MGRVGRQSRAKKERRATQEAAARYALADAELVLAEAMPSGERGPEPTRPPAGGPDPSGATPAADRADPAPIRAGGAEDRPAGPG